MQRHYFILITPQRLKERASVTCGNRALETDGRVLAEFAMSVMQESAVALAFLQSKFETLEIKKRVVSIGRDAFCDITIDDQSVSDHHCSIAVIDANKAILTDLDTKSGTFVGDKCVRDGELNIYPGDTIRFGNHKNSFLFTISPTVTEVENLAPAPLQVRTERSPHGTRQPLQETVTHHLFAPSEKVDGWGHPAPQDRQFPTIDPGTNLFDARKTDHTHSAPLGSGGQLEQKKLEAMQKLIEDQRTISEWENVQQRHTLRQINLALAQMSATAAAQAAAVTQTSIGRGLNPVAPHNTHWDQTHVGLNKTMPQQQQQFPWQSPSNIAQPQDVSRKSEAQFPPAPIQTQRHNAVPQLSPQQQQQQQQQHTQNRMQQQSQQPQSPSRWPQNNQPAHQQHQHSNGQFGFPDTGHHDSVQMQSQPLSQRQLQSSPQMTQFPQSPGRGPTQPRQLQPEDFHDPVVQWPQPKNHNAMSQPQFVDPTGTINSTQPEFDPAQEHFADQQAAWQAHLDQPSQYVQQPYPYQEQYSQFHPSNQWQPAQQLGNATSQLLPDKLATNNGLAVGLNQSRSDEPSDARTVLRRIGRLLLARRVHDLSSAWIRWTAHIGRLDFPEPQPTPVVDSEEIVNTRSALFQTQERLMAAQSLLQQAKRAVLKGLLRARHRAVLANVFWRLRREAEAGRLEKHEEKVRALGVAAKQTVALHVWRRAASSTGDAPTLDIVLAAWRSITVQRKRDRRLVASAARIMNRQTRSKVFRAWQAYYQKAKRERRLLAQMKRRRDHVRLSRNFVGWREAAKHLKRQKMLIHDTVGEFRRKSPEVGVT